MSRAKAKVILLMPSFSGGGAERVQMILAREFQRLNYDVTLLVFAREGPLESEVPADLRVVSLDVRRVSSGVMRLVRFLRTEKPDGLISSMAHVGTVTLLAALLAGFGGKVLVRLDTSRRYFLGQSFLRDLIQGLLQKWLFPRADAIIGVSRDIVQEFEQDLKLRNCRVIHNPVEVRPAGAANGLHPFFDQKEPVVLAIGRLSREKGYPFLLAAFDRMRKNRPARLIILGEGPERASIAAEIARLGLEKSVALGGFVNNPQDYLGRAAVYALSSESEPFGLTLVEALGQGVPVVSTATEGPRDIITDPRQGALIDFGDVAAFAAALERALQSPRADRAIRKNRAGDFAPSVVVEKYVHLLGQG